MAQSGRPDATRRDEVPGEVPARQPAEMLEDAQHAQERVADRRGREAIEQARERYDERSRAVHHRAQVLDLEARGSKLRLDPPRMQGGSAVIRDEPETPEQRKR